MMLDLEHKKLPVYGASVKLYNEAYRLTKKFPPDEKFNLTQQIRRASLSIIMNIAEGSAKKSPRERCRYFETARASVVEVDTGFEAAMESSYISKNELELLSEHLNTSFGMLSAIIKTLQKIKS